MARSQTTPRADLWLDLLYADVTLDKANHLQFSAQHGK
jgi:hypothetical protein